MLHCTFSHHTSSAQFHAEAHSSCPAPPQGVTIASQRRYVRYFWDVLRRGGQLPSRRAIRLRRISFSGLPPGTADSCTLAVSYRPQGSPPCLPPSIFYFHGPAKQGAGCLSPCVGAVRGGDGPRVEAGPAGDWLQVVLPALDQGPEAADAPGSGGSCCEFEYVVEGDVRVQVCTRLLFGGKAGGSGYMLPCMLPCARCWTADTPQGNVIVPVASCNCNFAHHACMATAVCHIPYLQQLAAFSDTALPACHCHCSYCEMAAPSATHGSIQPTCHQMATTHCSVRSWTKFMWHQMPWHCLLPLRTLHWRPSLHHIQHSPQPAQLASHTRRSMAANIRFSSLRHCSRRSHCSRRQAAASCLAVD